MEVLKNAVRGLVGIVVAVAGPTNVTAPLLRGAAPPKESRVSIVWVTGLSHSPLSLLCRSLARPIRSGGPFIFAIWYDIPRPTQLCNFAQITINRMHKVLIGCFSCGMVIWPLHRSLQIFVTDMCLKYETLYDRVVCRARTVSICACYVTYFRIEEEDEKEDLSQASWFCLTEIWQCPCVTSLLLCCWIC